MCRSPQQSSRGPGSRGENVPVTHEKMIGAAKERERVLRKPNELEPQQFWLPPAILQENFVRHRSFRLYRFH